MSDKATILIQLDTDPLPSVFDRVVAVDAGAQHVFSYGGVTPENVMPLVHGCIFTRGPKDLHRTAIFIGGSRRGGRRSRARRGAQAHDPAVRPAASRSCSTPTARTPPPPPPSAPPAGTSTSSRRQSLVLGGTGPVGQRVARLLARHGGHVRIGSRQKDKAEAVCEAIHAQLPNAKLEAVGVSSSADGPRRWRAARSWSRPARRGPCCCRRRSATRLQDLKVAIDLNGVPPAGIEGVEVIDKGAERDGVVCYGAIGVGGTKMKIHKAAVAKLFATNNAVLDVEEIYDLALQLQ